MADARRRASVAVAWALLAVCVGALVRDVARMPDTYAFPRPRRARDVVEAAPLVGRARARNAVVAEATQRLAGGRSEELVVPRNLSTLLAVEADVFGAREQATLDARLMRPFLGYAPTVADYDPVLADVEVARLEQTGIEEYPLGVRVALAGRSSRAVLFTDSARERVWVVPENLAPRGLPAEEAQP